MKVQKDREKNQWFGFRYVKFEMLASYPVKDVGDRVGTQDSQKNQEAQADMWISEDKIHHT